METVSTAWPYFGAALALYKDPLDAQKTSRLIERVALNKKGSSETQ